MCEYRIRPYVPEMLGDVTRIERESFSCPWSSESFEQADAMENSIFLTVCAGETPVGFGCILLVAGEGELVDIAVSSAHRQKGLGQLLMTALLAEARKQETEILYLEVRQSNTAARSLYEKNGFEAMGVRKKYYKNPVEDAVLMRCVLTPEETI